LAGKFRLQQPVGPAQAPLEISIKIYGAEILDAKPLGMFFDEFCPSDAHVFYDSQN
jgi:hypothetical protein